MATDKNVTETECTVHESPAPSQADHGAAAGGKGRGRSAAAGSSNTKQSSSKLASLSEKKFEAVNSRLDKLETLLGRFVEALPDQCTKTTSHRDQTGMDLAPPEQSTHTDSISVSASSDYDYDMAQESANIGMDDDLDLKLNQGSQLLSQTQSGAETKVPAFAAKFAVVSDIGQPLDDELASSVNYLMSHHFEEKVLDETSSKYPYPSNCQLIDTPKVNQTKWGNLSASVRTRDAKFQRVQKSLTRGIAAYVSLLDPAHISTEQQDVLALLCNSNFEMNALRKELIKPDLNSKFTHLCKSTNPVTKNLFGDDLGKQVKDLQDQHKAAAGVMRGAHKRPRHAYQPYPYPRPSQGSEFSCRAKDAG